MRIRGVRTRAIVIGLIGVLVIGAFVALRGSDGAPAAPEPAAQETPAPSAVTVSTARRADFVSVINATGTVSAVREARIAARMPGRVTAVLVAEGDRVRAGTALLRLDGSETYAAEAQARAAVSAARAQRDLLTAGALPEERRQASNAVAQAKAALDQAQSEAERMRSLFAMGAVAKQQLDVAETQLRLAQSSYDSARQQQSLVDEGPRVEQIRASEAQLAGAQAALSAARIRVRDLILTAPFAGTIVQRMVEPGESVSPAVPSFLLAQLDPVDVELAVPERHRASIRQGQSATIRVDSQPGRVFSGRIAEISPGASAVSRSFVVKVRVSNQSRELQPGMFARGSIVAGTRPAVLQIPERAIMTTSGGPIVFVVRDGRALRRTITVGDRQNGRVEIVSGVSAGESVVIAGQEGLTDNQAVLPRASQQ